MTIVVKNNGNNFLPLNNCILFFKLFFFFVILFKKVEICDGLVKFKHGYRETRIWN